MGNPGRYLNVAAASLAVRTRLRDPPKLRTTAPGRGLEWPSRDRTYDRRSSPAVGGRTQ